MKKLLLLLTAIPIAAQLASPGDAHLVFRPSPTEGITNYTLYAGNMILSKTNLRSAPIRINLGTSTNVVLYDLVPGVWSFTVTAGKDGLESAPCNVLTVEAPAPPTQFRTVIPQFSATLTNWTDIGFFKLKIQ